MPVLNILVPYLKGWGGVPGTRYHVVNRENKDTTARMLRMYTLHLIVELEGAEVDVFVAAADDHRKAGRRHAIWRKVTLLERKHEKRQLRESHEFDLQVCSLSQIHTPGNKCVRNCEDARQVQQTIYAQCRCVNL